MESLVATFQGPYAYLVIFQVLVVAMLMLALLWLVMRRTLERDTSARPYVVAPPVPAPVVDLPPSVPIVEAAPPPPVAVAPEPPPVVDLPPPVEAPVVAEAPPVSADGADLGDDSSASTRSLKDKIKYLESKLLEYEILQEEIGTLSGLKMENEHLKAKVLKLEKKLGGFIKDEKSKGMAAEEPLSGEGQEPTFEGMKATEEPKAPAAEPAVAEVAATAEAPEGSTEGPSLEGILRQIDDLTDSSEPGFVSESEEKKAG